MNIFNLRFEHVYSKEWIGMHENFKRENEMYSLITVFNIGQRNHENIKVFKITIENTL
jgi:hypothetical protein